MTAKRKSELIKCQFCGVTRNAVGVKFKNVRAVILHEGKCMKRSVVKTVSKAEASRTAYAKKREAAIKDMAQTFHTWYTDQWNERYCESVDSAVMISNDMATLAFELTGDDGENAGYRLRDALRRVAK